MYKRLIKQVCLFSDADLGYKGAYTDNNLFSVHNRQHVTSKTLGLNFKVFDIDFSNVLLSFVSVGKEKLN